MAETPDPARPPLHDTHCHLDAYPDVDAALSAVEAAGIETTWVTTEPAHFDAAEHKADSCRHVRVAAGLHPQDALRCRDQLPQLLEQIGRCVWVGEVGLDGVDRTPEEVAVQRDVFSSVIRRCGQLGEDTRILTIHSRRAADAVLEMLNGGFPRAILHWFSGGDAALERAVAERRWFSVNPAMAASRARRPMLKRLPRDRVLLESDGPYAQIDGRGATHADVERVIPCLASLWGLSQDEVRQQLARNYHALKAGLGS